MIGGGRAFALPDFAVRKVPERKVWLHEWRGLVRSGENAALCLPHKKLKKQVSIDVVSSITFETG